MSNAYKTNYSFFLIFKITIYNTYRDLRTRIINYVVKITLANATYTNC